MKRKTIYAAIIGAILLFFPSPIFAQEAGEEEIEFNLQGGDDTPEVCQTRPSTIYRGMHWLTRLSGKTFMYKKAKNILNSVFHCH